MSAGIADHRVTKGSPPCSSNTKTSALMRMMTAVTTERCRGRRDASPSGIMVPMLSSTLAGAGGEPRSVSRVGADVVERSEERRVGKERKCRGATYKQKEQKNI